MYAFQDPLAEHLCTLALLIELWIHVIIYFIQPKPGINSTVLCLCGYIIIHHSYRHLYISPLYIRTRGCACNPYLHTYVRTYIHMYVHAYLQTLRKCAPGLLRLENDLPIASPSSTLISDSGDNMLSCEHCAFKFSLLNPLICRNKKKTNGRGIGCGQQPFCFCSSFV